MCGIFGYVSYDYDYDRMNKNDTTYASCGSLLVEGLRYLEYRGYDSAGVYMVVENESLTLSTAICKSLGNIDKLDTAITAQWRDKGWTDRCVDGSWMGIAHTRWATHGVPSERNTHPHVSDAHHDFVVVHNGIITNFMELKTFLQTQGHTFQSDTDSEVIAVLCKYVYDTMPPSSSDNPSKTFCDLVKCVVDRLDGSFAILVVSKHYPMEMVATKRGSPLILGIQQEAKATPSPIIPATMTLTTPDHHPLAYVIASDLNAIIGHTKRTLILLDDDILHITRHHYRIYNAQQIVTRDLNVLDMEISQIMKGSYEYFMEKEIFEQPHSLQQTMNGRIAYANDDIKMGGIFTHLETIRHSSRLVFIASGTSFHACLAVRPLFEKLIDIPVAVENSCDLVDRGTKVFPRDTCVFVTQSGETADALVALRIAKLRRALCVGITNVVGSTISRETDCGIHVNAGTEIGVASTKSYTSQIVVMILFALVLANDSVMARPIRTHSLNALRNMKPIVRGILHRSHEFKELAESMLQESNILFIGRGHNYATALEASLKIKEVAYVHCEGIIAGELKHGPLALIDDSILVVVIATSDDRIKSSIEQLLSRGARMLILTDDPELYPTQRRILMPTIDSAVRPILDILPFQLIAYYMARAKGYNVDQPRNLAKSVTVTD